MAILLTKEIISALIARNVHSNLTALKPKEIDPSALVSV